MSNLKTILNSFYLRDNLNPKIWKQKGDQTIINPKVRERLLEISNEFIDFLKVDIIVSDIIMTGSLANYNWSNFSDVDLHIVIDFDQFSKEQLPLYEELFKIKKTLFNDKHDITIYGYDVELYAQNESETHFSSGVYSILNDEWITKPQKEEVKIDTTLIKNKSEQWMKIIDGVIEAAKDEPLDEARELIGKYKDKLKKYRTCGLEKNGEYSDENLVFKTLRRNGYIEKLFNFDLKHTDDTLSLREEMTNIGGTFKTDLENGPISHRKRALGNWQSDNAWDVFSPPGTIVNSYTKGIVEKIKDTGRNKGKIFGTQVSIKGQDGYPDIFYTHLKEVTLNKGDSVNIGDYIGRISEWIGHEGMEHVHIGLPKGYNLKDLLKDSDKIFTGSQENNQKNEVISSLSFDEVVKKVSDETGESEEKIKDNLQTTEDSEFLTELKKIAESNTQLQNEMGSGEISYDKKVEVLQTALQYLGFSLPRWGVDGKFGPETEQAVRDFQTEFGLTVDGVMNQDDLNYIFVTMVSKGFKDSDLSDIQIISDFDKIKVGNDKEFYETILNSLGAPITDENLKFLYAWRQAEGGKATNNPFNTTFNLKSDTGISNYNKVGVKNYSQPKYGIEATVKTLTNGRYGCLVRGFKENIGSEELASCLQTTPWGTGELVTKVLSGTINPPQIYA